MRRGVPHRKFPQLPVESMVCGCGKDATENGYTVEIFGKDRLSKPTGLRLCRECYEQSVRRSAVKYKGSVTSAYTKGYYK